MSGSELRKRGYYLENGFLVTPQGRFDISQYTGARVVDKRRVHTVVKWLCLSLTGAFAQGALVAGHPIMLPAFALFFLNFCWIAEQRYEVVGITSHGMHTVATIRKPFNQLLPSGEKELADAVVAMIAVKAK